MEYNPKETESKWQKYWEENKIYRSEIDTQKPKFYTLDMFPYPSGAGLHVGHPLGYIATDIIARYKKMKGFNVLHPMGFDSFGLPAEQYAIETGQHPAITTAQNIATFKKQLSKIGFNHDWSREVQTSSPEYYKWTQWIFQQIFQSWYNNDSRKAEAIETLIEKFKIEGNKNINAVCDEAILDFSAEEWNSFSEKQQAEILLKYRLTYVSDEYVNWCPALGTVLANDEIKDGFSERGGYPVERKKMRQWMMRITAYSDRLLKGLDQIEWSDALKDMQRNWIGKSIGALVDFKIDLPSDSKINPSITVFTTRIDTIFGVTFLVIAPEHELVDKITTSVQKEAVGNYVNLTKNRSERERQTEVKTVSGVFTGAYAINPFNHEKIEIWIADYVLAGYGTGAVMAVPCSDDRDFRFAKHFNLPIRLVIEGTEEMENPTEKKYGKMIQSGFLDGLDTPEAIEKAITYAEDNKFGKGKINFRLRDAVFSRQRYWGEPVPVYFKENIPYLIPENELPLHLPEIDEYKPTETGEPPLARAKNWQYEQTTMPGWAGSSWYFLRYMDTGNEKEFANRAITDYWNQVDLYIGGTEHAVGHLLYSRFWTKFLYDRGFIGFEEPFKKLINQGMIQGRSALMYRVKNENKFVSADLKGQYDTTELHIDVNIVENDILDIEAFKKWRPESENDEFVFSADGKFYLGNQVEKMSKRWYNVVNPDDVVNRYSADTLRLYEMFLGPLEQSKPWNTQGIDGVHRFLKKLWRMFFDDKGGFYVSQEEASKEELRVLHRTIKKIQEDIERYSFNTPVSEFMICVNQLTDLKCNKAVILEDFLKILAPYAPHITEELWAKMGHTTSIHWADYPVYDEKYIQVSEFEYPISINGKTRTKLLLPLDISVEEIEKRVLSNENVLRITEGKTPKKVIIVPNKIVNVVM